MSSIPQEVCVMHVYHMTGQGSISIDAEDKNSVVAVLESACKEFDILPVKLKPRDHAVIMPLEEVQQLKDNQSYLLEEVKTYRDSLVTDLGKGELTIEKATDAVDMAIVRTLEKVERNAVLLISDPDTPNDYKPPFALGACYYEMINS